MLKLTSDAKVKLYKMLMGNCGGQVSLRLVMGPFQKLGLVLDTESQNDDIFVYMGKKVLLISRDLSPSLDGFILGTRYENGNRELSINRI